MRRSQLVLGYLLSAFLIGLLLTLVVLAVAFVYLWLVSGVVLATSFGTHCESSYTAADLLELYLKAPFLVAAGAALFGMLVALIVIRQWRSTMPEHITAEAMEALDSGAPKRICIAYAYMAGSLGSLMQIFFKSTGELVGAGEFEQFRLLRSHVRAYHSGGHMEYFEDPASVQSPACGYPSTGLPGGRSHPRAPRSRNWAR